MFIYNIKPNILNCRYDAHRIVSSLFKKSIYKITDQNTIVVRTSESTINTPYDGSVIVSYIECDDDVVSNDERFIFNLDVYAQCIIDNKQYSVPKDKVTDWMKNKLNNAGFEVLDLNKQFLGCEYTQISKNKTLPTPINRFVGVIRVVDSILANESILKGFGKRKHLGLGMIALIR